MGIALELVFLRPSHKGKCRKGNGTPKISGKSIGWWNIIPFGQDDCNSQQLVFPVNFFTSKLGAQWWSHIFFRKKPPNIWPGFFRVLPGKETLGINRHILRWWARGVHWSPKRIVFRFHETILRRWGRMPREIRNNRFFDVFFGWFCDFGTTHKWLWGGWWYQLFNCLGMGTRLSISTIGRRVVWNVEKKRVDYFYTHLGSTPHPVLSNSHHQDCSIFSRESGNPYKPSFVTVTGWGGERTRTEFEVSVFARYETQKSWTICHVLFQHKSLIVQDCFSSVIGFLRGRGVQGEGVTGEP